MQHFSGIPIVQYRSYEAAQDPCATREAWEVSRASYSKWWRRVSGLEIELLLELERKMCRMVKWKIFFFFSFHLGYADIIYEKHFIHTHTKFWTSLYVYINRIYIYTDFN